MRVILLTMFLSYFGAINLFGQGKVKVRALKQGVYKIVLYDEILMNTSSKKTKTKMFKIIVRIKEGKPCDDIVEVLSDNKCINCKSLHYYIIDSYSIKGFLKGKPYVNEYYIKRLLRENSICEKLEEDRL